MGKGTLQELGVQVQIPSSLPIPAVSSLDFLVVFVAVMLRIEKRLTTKLSQRMDDESLDESFPLLNW